MCLNENYREFHAGKHLCNVFAVDSCLKHRAVVSPLGWHVRALLIYQSGATSVFVQVTCAQASCKQILTVFL
jgi:hypothetical protein